MKRKRNAWLAAIVTSCGIGLISLGIVSVPKVSYADTGPYCNEGMTHPCR